MSNQQFAPSRLPRQRRRHVDRALRKLVARNACLLCGSPFQPGTGTASGFDASGAVALAGQCCVSELTEIFGMGAAGRRGRIRRHRAARKYMVGGGRGQ
jgi:hypothetical protein